MDDRKRDAKGRYFGERKTKWKVCSVCGERKIRKLNFRDGYTFCRTCMNERNRERYRRLYKKKSKMPEGIVWSSKMNRVVEHHGYSTRIYWSEDMIAKLRRMFPIEKAADCAIELGVSARTVVRKARELGIEKDPEWIKKTFEKNRAMAAFVNRFKRNSGMIKKGQHLSPATEFKKKHEQPRTAEEKPKSAVK